MDQLSLVISSVEIIAGIIAIVYLLRTQRRGIALGIGGSMIWLGLIILAILYGLISALAVWVLTGSAVIIFASFCYVALRGNRASR